MMAIDIPPRMPPNAPVTTRATTRSGNWRSQAAEERAEEEAGVQNHERGPPREPIDDGRSDEPGRAGGEGVRRNDQAKFCGADVQRTHQLRAERHHDHEVDDRGELHGGQDEQNQPLAAGG